MVLRPLPALRTPTFRHYAWNTENHIGVGLKVKLVGDSAALKLWHAALVKGQYLNGVAFDSWDGTVAWMTLEAIARIDPVRTRAPPRPAPRPTPAPTATVPPSTHRCVCAVRPQWKVQVQAKKKQQINLEEDVKKKTGDKNKSSPDTKRACVEDHEEDVVFKDAGEAKTAALNAVKTLKALNVGGGGAEAIRNLSGAVGFLDGKLAEEPTRPDGVYPGIALLPITKDVFAMSVAVRPGTKVLMVFSPQKSRLALRFKNEDEEMAPLAGADVRGLPGLGAGTFDTSFIQIPGKRKMLDVAPPEGQTSQGSRHMLKRPRGELVFMTHDGAMRLAQFSVPLVPEELPEPEYVPDYE